MKANGLKIKSKFKGKSIDYITTIDSLDDSIAYDVIFVVVRFTQLDSILPKLINNKSKNIIFVGNNMDVPKYSNLPSKNVLFAFFSAAGKRNGGWIESICMNKITIGSVDGENSNDDFIKSLFKKTGCKVIIENKMDDYLKTHGCAVLPLVFAAYQVNGNLKLLKRDKAYVLKIMDAIIEGYDVLKALGYEILPKGEYDTCVKKKKLCAFMYRFMFSNFLGKLCISDHAMNAVDEFILMDKEFQRLKEKSRLETPTYDELRESLLKMDNSSSKE